MKQHAPRPASARTGRTTPGGARPAPERTGRRSSSAGAPCLHSCDALQPPAVCIPSTQMARWDLPVLSAADARPAGGPCNQKVLSNACAALKTLLKSPSSLRSHSDCRLPSSYVYKVKLPTVAELVLLCSFEYLLTAKCSALRCLAPALRSARTTPTCPVKAPSSSAEIPQRH